MDLEYLYPDTEMALDEKIDQFFAQTVDRVISLGDGDLDDEGDSERAATPRRTDVARATPGHQVAGLKLDRARRWGYRAMFSKMLLWWPRE